MSWGLALSVFLACAVEAVEALTIVLAMGTARSWRSALYGAGAGAAVLAVLVAALGPAVDAIPINGFRVVAGVLLLCFGLQWLRKAILRSAGLKAMHDEAETFRAETARAAAQASATVNAIDRYSFAVTFKAVLLEGLEVVFIVITFGSGDHRLGVAAVAAAAAVACVIAAGVLARAPLSRVPENTMKFTVGLMLTTFGTFWSVEGAGTHWPGGDAALLVLIPAYGLVSWALVAWLRRGGTALAA